MKRMRVCDPDNKYFGNNVIAVNPDDSMVIVYFTEGQRVKATIKKSSLAKGWEPVCDASVAYNQFVIVYADSSRTKKLWVEKAQSIDVIAALHTDAIKIIAFDQTGKPAAERVKQ